VQALRAGLHRAADRLVPAQLAVFDLVNQAAGMHLARALIDLGVFDALASGPQTAEELAAGLDLHADSLHRTLRLAATRDLVTLDRRARFRLGRLGRLLTAEHPQSMRAWTRYFSSPATQEAWRGLAGAIRTGEPAFPTVHGKSVWAHFADHPDEEADFADGMRRVTELNLPAVVGGYPWPQTGTVCDVAGGVGTMLAGILRARPGLRGVLVDGPGVLREADPFLASAGVRERVRLSEGDIFEGITATADLYTLKDVIHDWDDERSLRILETVRAAMPAGARVVLVELLQERNVPDPVVSGIDVQMLTQTDGGRQRSAGELHALLRAAGLRPGEVHLTAGPALVEGFAA
jgi:hypothetical protein